MAIVTLGIDLAKNVFALHGVDVAGRAVLVRPSVARSKLLELVASLPPCLIGMEACSGAPEHALRSGQEHRAAVPVAGAPRPPGVRGPAHGHPQPHPRATVGAGDRAAAEGRHGAARGAGAAG